MRSSSVAATRLLTRSGVRLAVALALVLAPGCGKSTKPKPVQGQTFTGAVAGPTISGKLTVTIATDNPIGARAQTAFTATGTLVETAPASQTITLSGHYDDTFTALEMTGPGAGGALWLITADPQSFGLSGYADSDTNNVSSEFCYHSLFKTSADVSIVLGTYSISGPSTGTFNFSIRGAEVRGDAVSEAGVHTYLVGTYGVGAADSIKVAASAGAIPPLAAGRLVGTTASGEYYDASGAAIGTWTGTKQP